MAKSTYEIIEEKMLKSEYQKKELYPVLEIDSQQTNLLKFRYKGIDIGELILNVNRIEFDGLGGMDIDLSIRNIKPLSK